MIFLEDSFTKEYCIYTLENYHHVGAGFPTTCERLGLTMFILCPEALRELKITNKDFPHISHGILVHTVLRDSPAHKYSN